MGSKTRAGIVGRGKLIGVSAPRSAMEEGTCSACSDQITPDGTAHGAMVHVVSLRRMSFRVCGRCRRDLIWALGGESSRDADWE